MLPDLSANPPFRTRIEVADAIDAMVAVLGSPSDGNEGILLLSSIDQDGFVGPGEALSLVNGIPTDDQLFRIPRSVGASAVLYGSPATRSVFDPDPRDVELTKRLLHAGDRTGITIVEHVLVDGPRFRLMCESLRDSLI